MTHRIFVSMGTLYRGHCLTDNKMAERNPCLICGACCIVFRASFYWAEGDDIAEGGVPVHLTEKVNAFRRAMRKRNSQDRRCIALEGIPGRNVRCTIYEHRPSVCRNFEPSRKAGGDNPRCRRARAVLGFEPLASQEFPGEFRNDEQRVTY